MELLQNSRVFSEKEKKRWNEGLKTLELVEKSTSIYVKFGDVSHCCVSVGSRTINDEYRHDYVSHRMLHAYMF